MVLQNRYKARASRRYQSQRGGSTSSTRGRGGSHGHPNDRSQEEEEVEEHTGSEEEDEEAKANRAKYSRRKMDSNDWRFDHGSEEEEDPEAPPEPEVDLTSVFQKARIAHQQDNEPSKDAGEDQDDDVDQSLAHLNHSSKTSNKPDRAKTTSYIATRPDGYEEAQRANREARERSDAKMKIWGKLEDDLDKRKAAAAAAGNKGKTGTTTATAKKQVLQGQDYLDSILN